jgi:hypothetical protein
VLRLVGVLAVLATLVLASNAGADKWRTPERRVVSSPTAGFELVVDPHSSKNRARISLFRVSSGKRTQRYSRPAVNDWTPLSAFVTDDGRVVTLNEAGRMGYEHTLVIYDPHGRVVVDRHLDDVLLKEEQPLVRRSVSSRHWLYRGEPPRIVGERLMVTTSWGSELAIDLVDGSIRRSPQLFPNLVFFARRSGRDLMRVEYELVDARGRLECDWDRGFSRCWLRGPNGDQDFVNRNLLDPSDLRGRLEPLVRLTTFVQSPVSCGGCQSREELRLFLLYDGNEYAYSVVLEGKQRRKEAPRAALDALLRAFRFGRERDADHR